MSETDTENEIHSAHRRFEDEDVARKVTVDMVTGGREDEGDGTRDGDRDEAWPATSGAVAVCHGKSLNRSGEVTRTSKSTVVVAQTQSQSLELDCGSSRAWHSLRQDCTGGDGRATG